MVSREPTSASDELPHRLPAAEAATPLGSQQSSYQPPAADDVATATDKAREHAAEALHAAQKTVDAQRDTVAGGLDSVAAQLRVRAAQLPGGDTTTDAAQTAARGIESASGYLREHDVDDMRSDLERLVRSHPIESMVVALAAGFLFGRAFKR